MAWPNAYTVNFCPNPRFQNDLTGHTPRGNAILRHDVGGARVHGDASCWVHCPGDDDREGISLAAGLCEVTGQGCASFYLIGHDVDSNGILDVIAYDQTAGVVLGETQGVNFDQDGSWQRVVLNNLALVAGHYITVFIETHGRQRCDFNIDSCQWEPQWSYNFNQTPTPYSDGDEQFGDWDGTPNASLSFKLYEIMISANGNVATNGTSHLLNVGEIFYLTYLDPASGPTQAIGGTTTTGTTVMAGFNYVLMVAGLTDFAMFQVGDIDPAISLVGWNNAGITTGTNTSGSAGYNRAFATFSAPQLFQGSTGSNIWNQAAYFALGYQVGSMSAGEVQHVTHAQAELVPNTGSPTLPTAYVRPRALSATIAPLAMNFVTNPSFEAGVTNWTAFTGTTLTQSNSQAKYGTYSGELTGSATDVGAWITVESLIVGETYTASAWVYLTSGATQVTLAINPTVTSTIVYTIGEIFTPAMGAWVQVDVQFTAPTSDVILTLYSTGTGTQTWFLDGVMIAPGGDITYGDGSFDLWNWEGTAGLSRSYFYERGNISYPAVVDVLANHLPLGITALEPIYNVPVTQYS